MKSIVWVVHILCAFLSIVNPVKSFEWENRGIGIRRSTGCDFLGKPFNLSVKSNPNDCENSCKHTQDCSSFVWFQNGTCFLKSGPASEDVAQVSSDGPSTVCGYLFIAWISISRSEAWALDCDFPTETFKELPSDGSQCGSLCWQNEPCNHFTFTNLENGLQGEGGVCLLKSGHNSRNSAFRVTPGSLGKGSVCGFNRENISANSQPFPTTTTKSANPVKSFEWENRGSGIRRSTGCDFPGNPLEIRQNSNPIDCEKSCQYTIGCSKFAWFQNGTCFLKSGPASADVAQVSNDGPNTVCGYLFIAWEVVTESEAWALDCDFPTETFKRIPGLGTQCGSLCWQNKPCNHFTFTNLKDEGGMCLLKTGNNSRSSAIRRTPGELGLGSVCGFNRENEIPISIPDQDQCDCDCP